MKKIYAVLLSISMMFSLAACGSATAESKAEADNSSSSAVADASSESELSNDNSVASSSEAEGDISGNSEEASDSGTNVLIAYFSATGTTKKVAEYAAEATGAELYEIIPAEPYSTEDLNYNNSDCRANTEMNDPSSRPEISGSVENMADYDIVFIAYPIWWGEAPRIISSFVESYDFSGKTVVTFCTSGGSGLNDDSIKELVSGAEWISGTRFSGNSSQSDVAEWINSLGLDNVSAK